MLLICKHNMCDSNLLGFVCILMKEHVVLSDEHDCDTSLLSTDVQLWDKLEET